MRKRIKHLSTEELVGIAASAYGQWSYKTIERARKELLKREVSENEQSAIVQKIKDGVLKLKADPLEREASNENKSYTTFEMLMLFAFGPVIFFKSYGWDMKGLYTLNKEGKYLKFRQRLILFILSFTFWIFFGIYMSEKSDKEWREEIERQDISEWEKEHGYD